MLEKILNDLNQDTGKVAENKYQKTNVTFNKDAPAPYLEVKIDSTGISLSVHC